MYASTWRLNEALSSRTCEGWWLSVDIHCSSGTTTLECDVRFALIAGETPHCARHFSSGDLLVMLRTIDVPMVQRAGRSDTFEAVRVVWEFRAGEKGLQFFQVGGSKRFLAGVGSQSFHRTADIDHGLVEGITQTMGGISADH